MAVASTLLFCLMLLLLLLCVSYFLQSQVEESSHLLPPSHACLNIKLCSRAFFSPGTWMTKLCSGTCLRAELLCRYLLVFALFYSILYTARTPWECRHYSFSKVLWLLVGCFFFCFAQHSPFVSLCKVCDMQ